MRKLKGTRYLFSFSFFFLFFFFFFSSGFVRVTAVLSYYSFRHSAYNWLYCPMVNLCKSFVLTSL